MKNNVYFFLNFVCRFGQTINHVKENNMKSIKDALKSLDLDEWSKSLKENAIQTDIKEPAIVHHRSLEQANLLTKKVINGVPQININLLESCHFDGCTASHCGIHTRQEVRTLKDLLEYKPVMIQTDGKEFEDISKRPSNLIIDESGMWIPVEHSYTYGVPCKYCGLTNKYLMNLKNSGLTADAINKHVDNYDFESGLEQLALDFVKGIQKGGLIYGNTGNGKTHLLCALARELIFAGKKVRYVSHQQLLETIKKSFDKNSDVIDPRYSWLDGVQVVMFDELGFFRQNEWSRQTTNELIHAIYAAGVQVLFASNLTPKQMKSQFLDMRSVSRISEMCKGFVFKMTGKDRRANDEMWI